MNTQQPLKLDPEAFVSLGSGKLAGDFPDETRGQLKRLQTTYPELSDWGHLAVNAAWRAYSQLVMEIEWCEDRFHLRDQSFLSFLYEHQNLMHNEPAALNMSRLDEALTTSLAKAKWLQDALSMNDGLWLIASESPQINHKALAIIGQQQLSVPGKKVYTVRAADPADSAIHGSSSLAQAIARLQPINPDVLLVYEAIQGEIQVGGLLKALSDGHKVFTFIEAPTALAAMEALTKLVGDGPNLSVIKSALKGIFEPATGVYYTIN